MSKANLDKLTGARGGRAIAWFADAMGLGDWRFRLWVQDDEPDWRGQAKPHQMGSCIAYPEFKEATIWVSPRRCREQESCPWECLWHECAHVVLIDVAPDDRTAAQGTSLREEFFLNRLAALAKEAYLARRGRRRAQ